MRRSIAAILAVFNVLNGLTMLFAGPTWWTSVPGASETGPFNPHFVQDVGAAFLVAGLASRGTGRATGVLAGSGGGRRIPCRACPDPPRDDRDGA